ncbi:MAG TPA: DMT family transporter [Sedimenticola sp.]|nr:DMT family transporter [Sedimenticola sp.]
MPDGLSQPLNQPRTIFGLATGAFLISFSSIFVRLSAVGPTTAGFYRMLFGALALALAALLLRERWRVASHTLLWSLAAALMFAADLSVWHRSIDRVGPGLATVLGNFQVFVMIGAGALFLGERVTGRTLGAVALAIAGLLLLVGPGWGSLSPAWRLGVLLGLATAFFYAAYMMILRRMQQAARNPSPIWSMTLMALFCSLLLGLEVPLVGERFAIPDLASLAFLLAYGILCQALGWYLLSSNIPRATLGVTGITILLQPALSFAWDMLLFDRPTTLLDLTGALLTLTAIYYGVTRQKRLPEAAA